LDEICHYNDHADLGAVCQFQKPVEAKAISHKWNLFEILAVEAFSAAIRPLVKSNLSASSQDPTEV
jgi:hypothetical protein